MATVAVKAAMKAARPTGKTQEKLPTGSKAALLVLAPLLLAALAAAPAAAQGPPYVYCGPSESSTLKTSSDSAFFYTSASYGNCGGSCYANGMASQGMTRDEPGKPTKTTSVDVYVSCYSYCGSYPNGTYTGFYARYSTDDPTGLSISKNLNTASVTASLTLDYAYSYGSTSTTPPSTASVSVTGNANGLDSSSNKCTYTYSHETPCGTIVQNQNSNNGGYQSATFTGSITVGGTSYPMRNSTSGLGNGEISKNDYISRTLVTYN